MNSLLRNARPLLAGAIVVALVASSGCRWFRSSDYTRSVENRPLEVPPGLDLPSTNSALPLPASSGLGGTAQAPVGYVVAGTPEETWTKMDAALAATGGVTIVGKAQALGTFDVNYQGQNFLIRIENTAGQSRVSAISPAGQVLRAGPASILLDELHDKL